MKKLFTLCALMLLGIGAFAQVDETFQFIDEQGNVVPDGSVLTVTVIDEEGKMIVPLSVKNTSGARAAVSMYETIDAKPNGDWQTCAFGSCMILTETGYSSKGFAEADYNANIETEWIPEEGGYASWTATLQIHVFDIKTETVFGKPVEKPGDNIIGYGPKVTVNFVYAGPSRQLPMGGYTSDACSAEGLGLNASGTYKAAILLPVEAIKPFDGGKVVGMRVAMATAAQVSRVFITPIKNDAINSDIVSEEVSSAKAGWSEFALENPVTLDFTDVEAILLGFDYQQVAGTYPLSAVEAGSEIYDLFIYGDLGQGEGWYNLGNSYGNLSVQAIVEGDFDEYAAEPLPFGNIIIPFGGSTDVNLQVVNRGAETLSDIDYVIDIDGVEGDVKHATASKPITFGDIVTFTIPFTSAATEKTETRAITILKVNGQDNTAENQTVEGFVVSTSKNITRRVAVEEYTGTGCGWCPRGMVGMEKMRNTFGDQFVGIAVHQYNSTDPMYIAPASYANLSLDSAPSCVVNRKYKADPYQGRKYDILDDIRAELAIPALAGVEVEGYWNEDSTKVDAKATVLSLIDAPTTYKVEFVLIADSLTGTTNTWKQANYYAQYTTTQLPDDIAPFAKGGVYGQSSVLGLKFNDVAISSSYVSNTNRAPAVADLTPEKDGISEYTLSLPTKVALKNALNKNYIYVAALLIDNDGVIVNSAKALVKGKTDASGISNMSAAAPQPVKRYSLDGRQMQQSAKGINIVRMADGSVRKVLVK